MRFLFAFNLNHASLIVVQTDSMREKLQMSYPRVGKVKVIGVPPSDLYSFSEWIPCERKLGFGLRLFYPAGNYPHKNHSLLFKVSDRAYRGLNVERIVLTVDKLSEFEWNSNVVQFVGQITSEECFSVYQESHALLFLSKNESYGIPLVEAMFMGIFIVCPDLDYARALCGESAIYFDPDSVSSLLEALSRLRSLVYNGIKPDWSAQLARIPKDWNEVGDILFRELSEIANSFAS
jgi:glycosyltransferase involved in cell wall biosynthesis